MPHFILEYSANLEAEIQIPRLFEKLHEAALATGVFPLGGIRSRALRCEHYRISDGDPHQGFVHLTLKVGTGRDLKTLQVVGEKIFQTLTQHLQPVYDQWFMGISFEMVELHPDLNFKQNNIHQRFQSQPQASSSQ